MNDYFSKNYSFYVLNLHPTMFIHFLITYISSCSIRVKNPLMRNTFRGERVDNGKHFLKHYCRSMSYTIKRFNLSQLPSSTVPSAKYRTWFLRQCLRMEATQACNVAPSQSTGIQAMCPLPIPPPLIVCYFLTIDVVLLPKEKRKKKTFNISRNMSLCIYTE